MIIADHIALTLRNRVKATPDGAAYGYSTDAGKTWQTMIWTEVLGRTDELALGLLAQGINPGENVGIISPNRPEWSIADYAIQSIRAVTVPMYTTSTPEQMEYIIRETSMRVLFAGDQSLMEKSCNLFENCPTLELVVSFDESGSTAGKHGCISLSKFVIKSDAGLKAQLDERLASANINDLATIIYTSGTTGDPKGVMLDQGSLKHLFRIHEMRLKVDTTDRSLSFLPLSHIFERGWAYFIMYSGAHNYFLQNPRTVIDVLPRVKPTLMCAVPRFFEKTYQGIQDETSRWPAIKRVFFKRAIAVGEERLRYVTANKPIPAWLQLQLAFYHKLVYSKLRKVLGGEIRFMPCAGAAASTELLTFFHSAGINIKYGYGATETTASVSCFRDYGFDLTTVGEIMPEVEVKISPEGEIMVKGNTVFRGYYKKPAETAAVLRDGWYYTGDAGSLKPGGHLVMSERMRDIMKTSVGKYVSPQRIELLLGQDPLIEQIVTIGDDRRFVMGLIVPVYDRIDALARELRLREQPREDMLKDPKLIKHLNDRFNSLQTSLQPHERMVKFTLLPEPFSIEKGEMTSTLKLRRKEISRIYKDLIEEVYSS